MRSCFTLFEVMISLGILSLTLIGIYQSMSTSLFVLSSTENLWKAIVQSQNELLSWERSEQSNVSITQGKFEEKHPLYGFSWVRKIQDVAAFPELPQILVREVDYELKWLEHEKEYTYSAKIFIEPK